MAVTIRRPMTTATVLDIAWVTVAATVAVSIGRAFTAADIAADIAVSDIVADIVADIAWVVTADRHPSTSDPGSSRIALRSVALSRMAARMSDADL